MFLLDIICFFFADMPSLSGVSDMDYPLQGPGLVSVPNLPELSAVRRVPLPPELVEQFSRILSLVCALLPFIRNCRVANYQVLFFFVCEVLHLFT